jgi:type IV pilus assembly protein PilC
MLAEQTDNKMLAAAVEGCRLSIQAGASLSEAMRDYPKVFSDLFVTMVAAGEASGSLDVSFERMADQFEKDAKLKGLVKKASIYPIVVCVVALVVVMLLLTFVIPTFEDMLLDLGVELPAVTRFVIAASQFMQGYWWLLLLFLGRCSALVTLSSTRARPASTPWRPGAAAARVWQAHRQGPPPPACPAPCPPCWPPGIPLMEAMSITAQTMTNVFFRDALRCAGTRRCPWASPWAPPSSAAPLPRPGLSHDRHRRGDRRSGRMLTTLADYYDEEVEQTTQQVMALWSR